MLEKSRIYVVTFGCPKNIVDSEYLLGQLELNNAILVDSLTDADTLIINTCGFIQDAKQESINAILEAVERKNRKQLKRIIVMGCLSERYRKELAEEIPEVDYYFGTNQLNEVINIINPCYNKNLPLYRRILTTPSHYAYLKIAEGCDNPCSFCSIPLIRGKYKSRSIDELIQEARFLAEKGVKELILVAQDTTYYGLDIYGKRELSNLIRELNKIDEIGWIRLLYTFPAKFPMDLIDVFNECEKLCHYIDIPIQHCSDGVLKSMRRGITKETMTNLLMQLKQGISNLALRTTIIVGYPVETKQDFEALCAYIKDIRFHRLGVFKYSQEEGTEASVLGDPVPSEVKEQRERILMEIQKEISLEHNEELIGKTVKVIIDSKEGDLYIGRTEWDAPEIDQEVLIQSNLPLMIGEFYNVKITDATEYDLYASV